MPKKSEVIEKPVESIPETAPEPEPAPPAELNEKQKICARMGEIEKEYGGFGNIPVLTPPHEYFVLRTRLQGMK